MSSREKAREEWVQGLRDLADFLEASPALELEPWNSLRFIDFANSPEDLAAKARALGSFKKASDSGYLNVERKFGPHAVRVAAAHEEVCERVVVGRGPVKKSMVYEEEGDIVEWRCPESILALT